MTSRIDRPAALAAATCLGAVVSMHFDLLPLINQAWTRSVGLDEADVGALAGYALGGFAIGTLTSPVWVRRFRWRVVVAIGALAVAGLSVALPFASPEKLPTTMACLGVGVALVRAPIVTMLGDSSHPERVYGLLYAVEMAVAMLLSLVLTGDAVLAWGLQGILLIVGGVTLLSSPLVLALPNRGEPTAQTTEEPVVRGVLVAFILVGIAVFTFGVIGPWSFLEHVGIEKALLKPGSSVVPLALVASLCGSIASAFLDGRWGRTLPIALAATMIVAGILIMDSSRTVASFFVGAWCTNFGWNFALTFSLSLLARVDGTGRYVALSLAAMGLGAAGGAAFLGDLIVNQGYSTFLLTSALVAALGLGILAAASVLSTRESQRPHRG